MHERNGGAAGGGTPLEMIDYKLAKQLREAGFFQGGAGRWVTDPDLIVARDRTYVPTLSDLIEACGKQFWSVTRLQHVDTDGQRWLARDATIDFNGNTPAFQISGKSPEEAVARLWLVLQRRAVQKAYGRSRDR
jgi:hypothetical protein